MITKILLISLFCCGWKMITSENMLLYPLKKLAYRIIKGKDISGHHGMGDNLKSALHQAWAEHGNWILKPTFDCVMCYASFWGSIVYWLLTIFVYQHGVNIQTIVAWPIICMAVAAVNGLLYGLICKYEEYMR